MSNSEFTPPSRNDLFVLATAGLAGAVGGCVVCLLNGHWSFAPIALGFVFGPFGVVWLNIDRSDWTRLMAAALLCGVYPMPVLNMGKQYLDRQQAVGDGKAVMDEAVKLSQVSDNLSARI